MMSQRERGRNAAVVPTRGFHVMMSRGVWVRNAALVPAHRSVEHAALCGPSRCGNSPQRAGYPGDPGVRLPQVQPGLPLRPPKLRLVPSPPLPLSFSLRFAEILLVMGPLLNVGCSLGDGTSRLMRMMRRFTTPTLYFVTLCRLFPALCSVCQDGCLLVETLFGAAGG